jgi:hypothetical protein
MESPLSGVAKEILEIERCAGLSAFAASVVAFCDGADDPDAVGARAAAPQLGRLTVLSETPPSTTSVAPTT